MIRALANDITLGSGLPVASPVTWSHACRSTWQEGQFRPLPARTVLHSSCSSSNSAAEGHQPCELQSDGHFTRHCIVISTGVQTTGWTGEALPLALTAIPSSTSLPRPHRARTDVNGNQEGGRP